MAQNLKHILPDKIIDWVLHSVDSSASIKSVKRLQGSTSSTLHFIILASKDTEKKLVLRQFNNKAWLQEEPDVPLHEAKALQFATEASLPVPQLVAADETGQKCGLPVTLMTFIEGKVILKPQDMHSWLDELAKTLFQIHSVSTQGFPWNYKTYMNLEGFKVPKWSHLHEAWGKAVYIVRQPSPLTKQCFIHRDYHPTNVLWKNNKICGIVDWPNACIGPAGVDVGHCQVNLAKLFGVGIAQAFLTSYQRYAGNAFQYDPYWDLVSLVDTLFGPPGVYGGWSAFGIDGLTNELMVERIDNYLLHLLKRF